MCSGRPWGTTSATASGRTTAGPGRWPPQAAIPRIHGLGEPVPGADWSLQSQPYYSRTVTATDGSWSAKFIVLALNYWSTAQQTWFANQLAGPATTYTFVVHHEQNGASDGPPSLATVESMEAGHETLSLVGHSHIWQFTSSQPQVIVGNGGAPLDASGNVYGFTLIARQADGSLEGTNYCSYDCPADAGPTPQAVDHFTVP